jgi:septum formation protein
VQTTSQPLYETKLVLASTSGIRRKILSDAGLSFISDSPDIEEETLKKSWSDKAADSIAQALAHAKSISLAKSYPDQVILGADQTLIFEGQIYNKATDQHEAREQLKKMRGKTHTLQSALVCTENAQTLWSHVSEAKLHMRNFSDEFIDRYLQHGGPTLVSSVGTYKLEETGIHLFEQIEGDHYTVLGLPLLPLLGFLRQHKVIPE